MHHTGITPRYYFNGGEALTWEQLLYTCYKFVADVTWRRDEVTGRYRYAPRHTHIDHHSLERFFSQFRHNPWDGVWSEGYYRRVYVERLLNDDGTWDHVYKNGDWVPPRFTPHSYAVWDNFGRIINSADIRQALLGFDPTPHFGPDSWSWRRYRRERVFVFRRGPVSGIGHYRNHSWHKYRGNHGHTIQELKQFYRDRITARETRDEYGIDIRLGRGRGELDPYSHGHHMGCHGYGWKRSKKARQWQKGVDAWHPRRRAGGAACATSGAEHGAKPESEPSMAVLATITAELSALWG